MVQLGVLNLLFLVLLFVGIVRGQYQTIFESQFERLHHSPLKVEDGIITNYREEHIEQLLNHFNEDESTKWQQKFLANAEFFKPSGPIFIFVGGEWALTPALVTKGHIYDMAKDLNAYLFALEHRFYGNEPELPSSLDSLQYLTSLQALEDLKVFINHIKVTIPELSSSKVILFGSGYSASLSTFFMRDNPEMVSSVWASGTPTLALMNFYEYQIASSEAILKLGGSACYNRIENGFKDIENMLKSKRTAEVKALLQICDNFNQKVERDVGTLFSKMANEFGILVENHRNDDIANACSLINSAPNDAAGVAKFILKQLKGSKCNDFSYRSVLETVGDTTWGNSTLSNSRKWLYQSCNEFGWFPTSSEKNQIFRNNHPDEFFVSICMDAFGESFTKKTIIDNVQLTNLKHHGSDLRTYFTYGELDPWKAVGAASITTTLPLESHCSDFESISHKDSDELKKSKERIFNLIKYIVKE